MIWFLLMLLLLAALLGVLYLYCILPALPVRSPGQRLRVLFAHRGLWDVRCPENSMPAFRRAVQHGFGIELDVQPRQDGELMVFHDESLERMCGVRKPLSRCSEHDLWDIRLGDSDCAIPTLAQVLEEVQGKVPLMVEIKPCRHVEDVCCRADELLKQYPGLYCVESFDPRVLRWFRRHRPQVYRGQLTLGIASPWHRNFTWRDLLCGSLLQNLISRPDFIAYDSRTANRLPLRLVRLFHPVMVAWNVQSEEELRMALITCETAIFDSFLPASPSAADCAAPQDGESAMNHDQFPD